MKKIALFLTALILHLNLFGETEVKLNHKDSYDLGDIVSVDISINTDQEFNQVFFDLEYDSEVIDFLNYREGSLTLGSDSTVLFAFNSNKVIISVLWEDNITIYEDSNILTLEFKVNKATKGSNFKFNSYGIKAINSKKEGKDVAGTFFDSDNFTVTTEANDSYIWIRNPVDGTIINKVEPLTILFTPGVGYSVEVRNDSNNYKSDKLSSTLGYLDNISVPMVEGENLITALLYKDDQVVNIDSSTIKYQENNKDLEIEYPLGNGVISQNRLTVKVASSLENVMVNKEETYYAGYKNENNLEVYFRDIWLKPGFNSILVEASSNDDFTASRTISVYYEKRDEVFRINSPEGVKWKKDSLLTFKGEISNKYNSDGSLTNITYDLIFYPVDGGGQGISIVSKGHSVIEDATTLDRVESAFTFRNREPIDIGKLGAGTLEIIAYKNKMGTRIEAETRRVVTIDDSKLEIKLDQPVIYLEDSLSSIKKIEDFHINADTGVPIVQNDISITNSGDIEILKGERVIYKTFPDGWDNTRNGFLELSNSDLLYFTNKNGIARIKSRKIGDNIWNSYYQDSDKFYIYDIKETSKGLLLGVSNYNADGNSGLYLLKDNVLTNIVIGEPISHVQFIRTVGDNVFLYGNLYSNIYSFNLNSLEKDENGRLTTGSVNKIPLDNSLSLKDFNISQTLNSVALLTTENKLLVYSIRNSNSFKYEPLDKAVFDNVISITPGFYKNSSYASWLIQGRTTNGDTALYTIMERKDNGELKVSALNSDTLPTGDILTHGYYRDNYYILLKSLGKFRLLKGKFFFRNFIPESDNEFIPDTGLIDLEPSENRLDITTYNGIFWGEGYNKPLYNLRTEIMDQGDLSFSYKNSDTIGYKGLSYNIPSIWFDSNNINFKIDINSPIDSFSIDTNSYSTLNSWLEDNRENNRYNLYLIYDSVKDLFKVDIYFKELWVNSRMDFNYSFTGKGDLSPSLSDLKVKKKVPVKLPRNNRALLTVKGRVTDPTVSSIRVNSSTDREVHVDSSGRFMFDSYISGYNRTNNIKLFATNSLGDIASEEFSILLFDSVLGIDDLSFNGLNYDSGEYKTDNDSAKVSFSYYGLKGAVVGYEILSLNGDVVIKRGLFSQVLDPNFNTLLYNGDQTNLESGKVLDGLINLVPGGQRIRIFIENPGGKRAYYYDTPEKLPLIIYDLDESKQRILFTNVDFRELETPDTNPDVLQEMDIKITESDFKYRKRLYITGEIQSLQRVSDLRISTSSRDITLDNGTTEDSVVVDDINRFSFNIDIELEESNVLERPYYITVQPSAPYLSHLKSVIRLNIGKDFSGAIIVPDFSLMDDNLYPWEPQEKKFLNKPLRLIFDRVLPPEATIELVVNFNKTIIGNIVKLPGTEKTYKVVDNEGLEIGLTGIKFGVNRIRWSLYSRGNLVSASIMSNPYMKDFVFELKGSSSFIPTTVTTSLLEETYYTEETVPNINIVKDSSTNLTMELNGKKRRLTSNTIELKTEELLEGSNTLSIKSDKETLDTNYRILYDSKEPQIGDVFYRLDDDNNISYLGVNINEANIDKVKLYLMNTLLGKETQITSIDYKVEPVSSSIYRVTWPDIYSIHPKLNPLATNNPFRIEVLDKVQRDATTGLIYGTKEGETNPFGEIGVLNDSSEHYNKDSIDLEYRVIVDELDKHSWVFYGSNVDIGKSEYGSFDKNVTGDNILKISRPGSVKLGEIQFSDKTESIEVKGNSISLDSNFSLPPNTTLKLYPNSTLPEAPLPGITIDRVYEEFSINFQLKVDDYGVFNHIPEEGNTNQFQRIITFPSYTENKNDLYLGYKYFDKEIHLFLCYEEERYRVLNRTITPETWNNILINFSLLNSENYIINIYVNDKDPVKEQFDVFEYLIPKGSKIHFGNDNKVNNGHFTISSSFYVDRVISSGDVPAYIEKVNSKFVQDLKIPASSAAYYNFDTPDNFGPVSQSYKLRSIDHKLTDREDSNYDINGSALVAGDFHKNYVEVIGESIIFNDCEIPITNNLKDIVYNSSEGYIPLALVNSGKGRYTFGNRPTNHGIGNNEFYTISGRIERIDSQDDEKLDASLTVIINNNIKTFPIEDGNFSFVYDHDSTPPETVIVYLETNKDIYLYDNFQFVEGNAALNSDTIIDKPSLVSSKYYFLNSGTIELMYKPFNINPLGLVDYESTIIDTASDHIRIFTKYNSKLGFVEYVGTVGDLDLHTNTPVKEGWQKLLLTYSVKDKIARFYINDELKAEASGSMVPKISYTPEVDNLFIGGDINIKSYAQGYIDDVKITNLFNNTTPLVKDIDFTYYEDSEDTFLDLIGKSEIIGSDWNVEVREILPTNRLTSPLMYEFNNNSIRPLDIRNDLNPGLYFARLKGEYNNKRVNSIYHFIKDDKPNFNVVSAPKLIISGEETALKFKTHYDDSHLVSKVNSNRYPAFIIEVYDENRIYSERIFVCQDIVTKPDNKWKIKKEGDPDWEIISIEDGSLDISFSKKVWNSEVKYNYNSFYFINNYDEELYSSEKYQIDPAKIDTIPMASLNELEIVREVSTGKEYKLVASLKNAIRDESFGRSNFKISYEVVGHKEAIEVPFNSNGFIDLYYDDILKDLPYNEDGEKYRVKVVLIYDQSSFQEKSADISWDEIVFEEKVIDKKSTLSIKSLDLLYMKEDKELEEIINKASLYANLEYINNSENLNIELRYNLTVFDSLNEVIYEALDKKVTGSFSSLNLEDVTLGSGNNRALLEVYEGIKEDGKNFKPTGIKDSTSLNISTSTEAPEVFFTNTYPYYVSYNNLGFSWEGKYKGSFNHGIEYSYNLDNQGWSSQLKDSKHLDIYTVDEGFHILRVKAILNKRESTEIITRFFVDTVNPEINLHSIDILEKKDQDGVVKSIVLSGNRGALLDSSLDKFYINGIETDFNEDGEFYTEIDIYREGIQEIVFEAIDKVGNRTIVKESVDNSFIEIISPSSEYVEYSPLTLVGKISESITQDMNLFIEDPLYKGTWHKATINSDRVFFVDDIRINPGSSTREALTSFRLKAKMDSGREYYKDINVKAGNLFRPLNITLSNQATQGAGKPIEIDITATCESDISSWSIDYDGDGIYDDIDLTSGVASYSKVWPHSYSIIGEISPRVRVITKGGDYFTETKTLIIHDVIKAASGITISAPIDMGVSYNIDKSNKFFVLSGLNEDQKVDVFEVGSTYNYFSNKLYSVPLDGYITGEAKSITVLNGESFVITTESEGKGYIYQFSMNEYGNFVVLSSTQVDKPIKSITNSPNNLIFTYSNSSEISLVEIEDSVINFNKIKTKDLILPIGNVTLPEGCEITYSKGIIYVADYLRQSIVEFNEDIVATNYWGRFGYNDGEFVTPAKLTKYGTRLFIYDRSRKNIQVFNPENSVITSIDSSGDYLPEGFFTNISSIKSIGREEGGRLFYYIAALSKESDSLSLIRLPAWEELRAKTRNNKIVFVKDKELYTAKPDGSDLRKVLSTDSLPRVEGSVDYPTISPDGRTLAFISRDRIFTGELTALEEETYSYDNLYIMEIGGSRPTRIPLSIIDRYEIERPVFNSNGDTLAFSARTTGGFWQIYEYKLEDGTVRRLFDSSENLRFPFYSPDDRFIVYSTDYDGDEDLEIYDKNNPDIRVELTSNDFRDSYPVWSRVYPFEISNPESKIESKIAFVSDRGFNKGIHYAYISMASENDLRVVTKEDGEVGETPDIAAISLTNINEGDYPVFTGDGTKIVYENYDGYIQDLNKLDLKENSSTKMNLPEGSMRPSGMRNTITGFSGTLVNGNEVRLAWKPYTDHKTFYLLQFKKASENLNFTQKKIYSQDGTTVTGLEMNTEYLMRVIIEENEEMVATTRWLKMKIPEVVARPSYSIDKDNPYLVHFHAWKPVDDTSWSFSWIIDNQEVDSAKTSQDFTYQFGTSGEKSVQLRATNREGNFSSISKPMTINIVSDIKPVIEYAIIKTQSGGIVLDLDSRNSIGKRINYSTVNWTITGAGGQIIQSSVTNPSLDVSHFSGRANVNLKLSRQKVFGREETDVLEVNRMIDLTYEDLKPVITYLESEENSRLIEFDGTSSLGNIDWASAKWSIFSDGNMIHSAVGVSSVSYLFPESSRDIPYAASLTVTDSSSGLTKTTSQIISVDPATIEPVITSEVITLKDKNDNDIGVKVVLTATNSKGSSIDFSLSEWNLPVASQYGDQPKQRGATAIFNLANPGERSSVDVTLTLFRRGGIDAVTTTQTVSINARGVTKTEIMVNTTTEESSDGNVLIMDVLDSKGVDIDWANTTWLIGGQYAFKGPIIRLDRSFYTDNQRLIYSVTLNRFTGKPIKEIGHIALDPYNIKPHIDVVESSEDGLTKRLSVTKTAGVNIDWSRTLWSIWDGNEDVIQKRGGTIMHKFTPKEDALGYPVMAELFFKGSENPFYAYTTVQIDGDEIVPVIQWDNGIKDFSNSTEDEGDTQVISFSALSSIGSGIDWSQAKWNFGDGSAPAYGASVQHKYPVSSSDKKYNVSLTLYRNSRNGNKESKIVYKTIEIGKKEIDPVISAKIDPRSNTLILSAEASEGRGLLLDRSVWVFAGKGESENFSRSRSNVETKGKSSSLSTNAGITVGAHASGTVGQPGVASATIGTSISASLNIGSNISSNNSNQNSNNNNQSYSTQNTHTGALCRRYVEDFNFDDYGGASDEERMIWVTLFVYRLNSDGSMTGTSLTERININKVEEASNFGKSVIFR